MTTNPKEGWTVEAGETKHVAPGAESQGTGWFVVRPDGSAVCWVENEADAHMFSAAPELARMLEIALGIISKSKIIWMGADSAHAALAKARGE